jgi:hypothetical protein
MAQYVVKISNILLENVSGQMPYQTLPGPESQFICTTIKTQTIFGILCSRAFRAFGDAGLVPDGLDPGAGQQHVDAGQAHPLALQRQADWAPLHCTALAAGSQNMEYPSAAGLD